MEYLYNNALATLLLSSLCLTMAAPSLRGRLRGNGHDEEGIVTPTTLLIDDFADMRHYTRFGSNRGMMGSGVTIAGDGRAQVRLPSAGGWGGVWTSLMHTAGERHALDFQRPLGPAVRPEYQPHISGIQITILEGTGTLKVELKNTANQLIFVTSHQLNGQEVLQIKVSAVDPVHVLNWLLVGEGQVVIDEVRLLLDAPSYELREAVFLWSYANLYTTYDPVTGLTRDRAHKPSREFSSVQTMGTFALATALGSNLGYLASAESVAIISRLRDSLLQIPRHESGLLPHFLTNGDITPGTEYSSIDSVLSLMPMILACELAGLDASALRSLLSAIDWTTLTDTLNKPVSHGYSFDQKSGTWQMLPYSWDVFGSESWLVSLAASSTLGSVPPLSFVDSVDPKTWNGSGFNDWMGKLFVPLHRTDVFGVNWSDFLSASTASQLDFHQGSAFTSLFGHSASEVPEPWAVGGPDYGAWGTGGYQPARVTTAEVGTPIFAPHYWAMIMADYPVEAEVVWKMLIDQGIFTPLNNVESFTASNDQGTDLKFNALRGSWNLCLQTLGAARAVYASHNSDYPVYALLEADPLLGRGLELMLPLK
jgi:hypothetical protein